MSDTTSTLDEFNEVSDPSLRARIEDFLVDYVHMVDDARIPEWPDYFTEDAFYQITTRENHDAGLPVGIMQCKGRGMMKDRVKALYEANIFEPHVFCHVLGRPRIHEETPGLYRARTNFQVTRTMQNGDRELFGTGKYLDVIACDGTTPKLQERRVVLDSRRVDILIVYPL
mgnify:CR=1 FL=1